MELVTGSVDEKQIAQIADVGSFKVYCPKPHGAELMADENDDVYVIDKGFFICKKNVIIGLMHEKLEENLGVFMGVSYVDKSKWTKS